MKLKVKAKAIVLGAFIISIVGALIALAFYAQHRYRTWGRLTSEVQVVHVLILENRRREKDFLLRFDLAYQENVQAQTREILNRLRGLGDSVLDERSRALAADMATNVKAYARAFDEVVALYFRRGLNEVSGLRGELREAVHDVERILEANGRPELVGQMLTLRRREKDYLLRQESRYIELLQADQGKLLTMLAGSDLATGEKARIEQLLGSYLAAIKQVHATDIAIDEKIAEYREEIHKVESLLGEILAWIAADQEEGERNINRLLLAVTLVSVLGTGVFIYLDLATSLLTMGRLREVLAAAAAGDLEVRYLAEGADREHGQGDDLTALGVEIDALLEVFERFRDEVALLADGDLERAVGARQPALPAAYGSLMEKVRSRVHELEIRSGADPTREPRARDRRGLDSALLDNSASILTKLASQGILLSERLARSGTRAEHDDLGETFAELELVARGLMEQGRLMAALLARSRERES